MASGSRYVVVVDEDGYVVWERAPAYLIFGSLHLGWVEEWFQQELLSWIQMMETSEIPPSLRELAAQIQRHSLRAV